jgi:DNA-binding transcriptional MerR regulator
METTTTTTLLEPGDVARALDLSASMVRLLVSTGVLRTVARTRRGVRLFDETDVELLRLEREQRATRRRSVAVREQTSGPR